MSVKPYKIGLTVLVLSSPYPAFCDSEFTLEGNIKLEVRVFPDSQNTDDYGRDRLTENLSFSPRVSYKADGYNLSVKPYLSVDSVDSERSNIDLSELYVEFLRSGSELKLGIDTTFWGVTESRNLVDIVNQSNLAAEIDGDTKLGQPLVYWEKYSDQGNLQIHWLPYFRERIYPESRERLSIPFLSKSTLYESGAEEHHQDFALRWKQSYSAIEVALSYFNGTSREPRLVYFATDNSLHQAYDTISQVGFEFQWLYQQTTFKAEAIYREGHRNNVEADFTSKQPGFGAVTAGLEYNIYAVFATRADLGLIVELNRDLRPNTAPATLYDKDIYLGARLTANNFASTTALAGFTLDYDDGSTLFTAELSHRLNNNLRLSADIFWIIDASDELLLATIEHDSYISLAMSWYF